MGTPAVRQAVIIDTGSSFTAFPCTGCSKCGKHVNDYFDPKKSSTAQVLSCGRYIYMCISMSMYEVYVMQFKKNNVITFLIFKARRKLMLTTCANSMSIIPKEAHGKRIR